MAFFPGLPALLRLGLEVGLPVYLTGVVVSAVCSYLAATALARLGGPVAAVAWLFAPTAVYTACRTRRRCSVQPLLGVERLAPTVGGGRDAPGCASPYACRVSS